MTPTSETGHAKNVANFEDLVTECANFGTKYNPSNSTLLLPALQGILKNAQEVTQAFNEGFALHARTTNEREQLYKPLPKLCTRIINYLESTQASEQTVNDVYLVIQKIRGTQSSKSKGETTTLGETPKTSSTSQRSFDNQSANFGKLVTHLQKEPHYTPNEEDLKLPSLLALATALAKSNTEVGNSESRLTTLRNTRNTVLYAPNHGMLDIATKVKAYVLSAFNASAPEYKRVSKIRFTPAT